MRELAQHKLVSLFDAVSDAPQVPQLRLFARFLKIETRNDRDGAPTLLNLRPQRLPGSAIQFYIEARKWLREHRFLVDGPLIPRKLLNTMAMAAYDEWDGWGNDQRRCFLALRTLVATGAIRANFLVKRYGEACTHIVTLWIRMRQKRP